MSVKLDQTTIQKLTHESPEIRLRALEQIEAKLLRAFAHNEDCDFSPGQLFKQLIRWFGYQPVQNAEKVLVLILRLARSQYGPKAIEEIGLKRFIKELGKVKQSLEGQRTELMLVEQLIQEYNQQQDNICDIINLDKLCITDDNYSSSSKSSISVDNYLKSNSALFARNACDAAYDDKDNELPWSTPTIVDYNSLKLLADTLGNLSASGEELQEVLQHLQITMPDYPAEYMLQAPYIFHKLLELYERHENVNCPFENIVCTCVAFLESLKERLYIRSKCLTYVPSSHKQETGVQPKMQLKLEKAIQLLMEMCVEHLELQINELSNETVQAISLFLMCLEICEMQKLYVNKLVIEKLIKICKNLYNFCTQYEKLTLNRTNFLLIAFLLQQIAEINFIAKEHSEFELPYIQDALVFDYALSVCYPKRYKALKLFWLQRGCDLKTKCELLTKYECEIATAASLIKMQHEYGPLDILAKGSNMKFTLETFDSIKLVEILYNSIITCLPHYQINNEARAQAINLLLKLLSLPDENKVAVIYNMLAYAVKKNFACLMNGENYCTGICNTKLLAQQIIGVPLSAGLLFKLIQRGFASTHTLIMKNCEEIFMILLQSQNLLGKYWAKLLEILLPVMPLLQCYSRSTKITVTLMDLFDPDAGNVPFIAMLQGNIRFLFHRDKEIRNEVLTRIIYILNTVKDAGQYLPIIMEISDLIPNDVCIFKESREFSRIFAASETFNELSTLQNMLEILETPDIEPSISKSTLMQINVMCQNWAMSQAMCNMCAHFLPLYILESSLRMDGSVNYIESSKPAIGILQKLLLCDAEFREELAANVNIYLLLLRALFLFTGDIQAQQDATMCLFLLNFSTFIVVTGKIVEAPMIMSNFALPLRCQYVASEYKECLSEFVSIFKDAQQCTLYMRQFVASCFCDGGLLHIKKKWLSEAQIEYDLNTRLQLTQHDWRLVQATNPQVNFKRGLNALSNATDHKTVIDAATFLKKQLVLYNLTENNTLPKEKALNLLQLLTKFLHNQPGNDMDLLLFEKMLDVGILCIQLNLTIIVEGLLTLIQTDFQHPFILLLQNIELPLHLYGKICQALLCIINTANSTTNSPEASILYSNLFELFIELTNKSFKKRDLLRVRHLLSLMQVLSTKALHMPDSQLIYYCKKLLKYSIMLKSTTQTGAQLQRHCLEIVCSLTAQMKEPQDNYRLAADFSKYLSGMCGHSDHKVRALAWCCLANIARYDDTNQLIAELAFLPGGFPACCLSTLLDLDEMIMVRQMAGQLFADLLARKCLNFYEATLLLERHNFFHECHEALSNCVLTDTLCEAYVAVKRNRIVTCEIISCFCRICIELIALDSEFIMGLCEKPFMGRLYELVKYNDDDDVTTNGAYLCMCADICQLYASCAECNFPYIKRTICRDQIWLRKFCLLFGKPFTAAEDLQNIIQMLLVICRDQQSYEYTCENMIKTPQLIVNRLLEAFSIEYINTPLQHHCLIMLSFLLIKSQLDENPNPDITFVDVLHKPIEILDSGELQPDEQKENNFSNELNKNDNAGGDNIATSPLRLSAELIFMKLYRLFLHIYPAKSCKFDLLPNNSKTQICETLSILLKVSKYAQTVACNLNLLVRITQLFNSVQEEYNMPYATFERRYSESKKTAFIRNFQLLLSIILNWHTSTTSVLIHEPHVRELTKVLLQIWPWLAQSSDLKIHVLQLCQVVSEHSPIVCKHFSMQSSANANSILQSVLRIVTNETQRIKAASTEEFPCITIGLRIVSNCCSCPEGRNVLVKARVLDVLDTMYPFNSKASKLKLEIVHAWLYFWELFSHYEEGALVRSLSTLCDVINKSKKNSTTRLLLLKIIRNMSFLKVNCNALLNSDDFLCTVINVIASNTENNDTASADCSYEEELVVCVTIWKLISYGVKYVAMIRGTKFAKKLKILHEHLRLQQYEDAKRFEMLPHAQELFKTLEIIFSIFNS